ncbi:hypothetical protein T439DRAFT_379099 [Meredithblackwellia eburnea MCA 4105]
MVFPSFLLLFLSPTLSPLLSSSFTSSPPLCAAHFLTPMPPPDKEKTCESRRPSWKSEAEKLADTSRSPLTAAHWEAEGGEDLATLRGDRFLRHPLRGHPLRGNPLPQPLHPISSLGERKSEMTKHSGYPERNTLIPTLDSIPERKPGSENEPVSRSNRAVACNPCDEVAERISNEAMRKLKLNNCHLSRALLESITLTIGRLKISAFVLDLDTLDKEGRRGIEETQSARRGATVEFENCKMMLEGWIKDEAEVEKDHLLERMNFSANKEWKALPSADYAIDLAPEDYFGILRSPDCPILKRFYCLDLLSSAQLQEVENWERQISSLTEQFGRTKIDMDAESLSLLVFNYRILDLNKSKIKAILIKAHQEYHQEYTSQQIARRQAKRPCHGAVQKLQDLTTWLCEFQTDNNLQNLEVQSSFETKYGDLFNLEYDGCQNEAHSLGQPKACINAHIGRTIMVLLGLASTSHLEWAEANKAAKLCQKMQADLCPHHQNEVLASKTVIDACQSIMNILDSKQNEFSKSLKQRKRNFFKRLIK